MAIQIVRANLYLTSAWLRRHGVVFCAAVLALSACAKSSDAGSGGTGGGQVATGGTAAPGHAGTVGMSPAHTGGGGASGNLAPTGGTGGGNAPKGGAGGGMALAGAGGGSGTGGSMAMGGAGGGSGSGGTTAPVMYPKLEAAMFGTPTQITVTPAVSLAEGPLWDPCTHKLLFVDVMASTIYSLGDGGMLTPLATNTSMANGIAFDLDGSLILAQMGGNGSTGHVARRDKAGMITAIEPTGSTLHTPDDVVVRSDGTIYFTDGDFPPASANLIGAFSSLPVYGFKPGASMLTNGGMVGGPNGIELSPDEKTLYVDGYGDGSVWSFAVAADGSLTKNATAFATGLSSPDSLCVDAGGNLYVGVTNGLQVIRPDGSKVGLISITVPRAVTNCTFGGADGKTLYVTAWTQVWKIDAMPIPGLDWTVNQTRVKCM